MPEMGVASGDSGGVPRPCLSSLVSGANGGPPGRGAAGLGTRAASSSRQEPSAQGTSPDVSSHSRPRSGGWLGGGRGRATSPSHSNNMVVSTASWVVPRCGGKGWGEAQVQWSFPGWPSQPPRWHYKHVGSRDPKESKDLTPPPRGTPEALHVTRHGFWSNLIPQKAPKIPTVPLGQTPALALLMADLCPPSPK